MVPPPNGNLQLLYLYDSQNPSASWLARFLPSRNLGDTVPVSTSLSPINQHVGYLLQLSLANLEAELFVPEIFLNPNPRIAQVDQTPAAHMESGCR